MKENRCILIPNASVLAMEMHDIEDLFILSTLVPLIFNSVKVVRSMTRKKQGVSCGVPLMPAASVKIVL